MTNIFLVDPDIVLIWMQGETGLITVPPESPQPEDETPLHHAWGHMPRLWRNKPKIALISDPIKRFKSIVDTANQPAKIQKKLPTSAAISPISYDMAINILENENISFDLVSGNRQETLKQNLLPQTHPFNTLAHATHFLRRDALNEDFAKIKSELNLEDAFLENWKFPDVQHAPQLSEVQLERLQKIYADDFTQLGYDNADGINAPAIPPPSKRKSVYTEWPAFFETSSPPRDRTMRSLPPDDVNLNLFKNARATGKAGPTWMARRKNLAEHFRLLQPEFSGKSRLALLLACCIVTIRRTSGRGPGLHLFHRITKEHGKSVSKELNARWLVSVCDTFADHGENSTQRAIAMSGTILVNSVKLFETELKVFYPPRPWPPSTRFRDSPSLFDGLTPFWLEGGDMVTNLFARLEKICELDPVAGQFTKEALQRMLHNDTTFKRIHQIWRMPRADKLSAELDKKFKDLAKKEL